MELNLSSKQPVVVVVDEDRFEVKRFKMKQQLAIEAHQAKAAQGDIGAIESLVAVVQDCGLPREIIDELDAESFLELVKELGASSEKKK